MNKSIVFLALFISFFTQAQQNVGFRQTPIISPIINEDNSVTFKLKAPYSKEVVVRGDWEANNGVGKMEKGTDGIWTYTSPALPSDLYMYSFLVDSVRTLDPANAFSYRDVGNLFSIMIVGKGNGDKYSVNEVPHGTVEKVWYQSKEYKTERRLTVYTPASYKSGTTKYLITGQNE